MVSSQIASNINTLLFFFSFILLSKESSLTGNHSNIKEAENFRDLRKHSYLDDELQERLTEKIQDYSRVEDFLDKPFFAFVVVDPIILNETIRAHSIKKTIDHMLSKAFCSITHKYKCKEPVNCFVQVKNDKCDTSYMQNIKVTFKLSDGTLECLDKARSRDIAVYDSDLWCLEKILWNPDEETEIKTHIDKRMKIFDSLKMIQMAEENWIDQLNELVESDLDWKKMRQNKTVELDIDFLPPNIFHRTDYLMLLRRTNDLFRRKIPTDRFIKYLVYPRMFGNILRDLSINIKIGPPDTEDEKNQQYLKNMCVNNVIPRLQAEYENIKFQFESIFNAVEIDQGNEMDNMYRIVLKVFKKKNCLRISLMKFKNIVLDMTRDKYKDVRFTSSYNDFDYEKRNMDYLIVTFEIDTEYEDAKDFIEKNFEEAVLSYMEKNYPGQLVEMKIEHVKQQYPDMYDEDKYEVSLQVLDGYPNKMPKMLREEIERLTKKYADFKVTCQRLEDDLNNDSFKYLKICLELKKKNVTCFNPWTPEQIKEFFLSQENLDIIPVVPPGCTPPKKEPVFTPPGGHVELCSGSSPGLIEQEFQNTEEFVENIFKKSIIFYLGKHYPLELEITIKHKKDQCSYIKEDRYEVTMKVIRGQPDQITTGMLAEILDKLSEKYGNFKVACEVSENDPNSPGVKLLRLCLEVKKSNPSKLEGEKGEFLTSHEHGKVFPVVPLGKKPGPSKKPTTTERTTEEDRTTEDLIRKILHTEIYPYAIGFDPKHKPTTQISRKQENISGYCSFDIFEVRVEDENSCFSTMRTAILLLNLLDKYPKLSAACVQSDDIFIHKHVLKICMKIARSTIKCKVRKNFFNCCIWKDNTRESIPPGGWPPKPKGSITLLKGGLPPAGLEQKPYPYELREKWLQHFKKKNYLGY